MITRIVQIEEKFAVVLGKYKLKEFDTEQKAKDWQNLKNVNLDELIIIIMITLELSGLIKPNEDEQAQVDK